MQLVEMRTHSRSEDSGTDIPCDANVMTTKDVWRSGRRVAIRGRTRQRRCWLAKDPDRRRSIDKYHYDSERERCVGGLQRRTTAEAQRTRLFRRKAKRRRWSSGAPKHQRQHTVKLHLPNLSRSLTVYSHPCWPARNGPILQLWSSRMWYSSELCCISTRTCIHDSLIRFHRTSSAIMAVVICLFAGSLPS